jgi:homeobox protein YOX1/YHP1
MYSPTGFPQYQSPTSPAYPAGHSPPRAAVPTVASAHTHYQQPIAMGHGSLERTIPSSRSATQLPYSRSAATLPAVPYDIPHETAEPTIKKKRKRADARQLEALNRMYARTAFPSTEERLQLAKELDMSARSVQIWSAHTFIYAPCMISELSAIHFPRFQNKRQANRQGGRNPANPGPPVGQVTVPDGQHMPIHPRATPSPMSPMGDAPYPSRSPLQVMARSGQTPSPPRSRSRADIDPRRHWPGPGPSHGPSHGY